MIWAVFLRSILARFFFRVFVVWLETTRSARKKQRWMINMIRKDSGVRPAPPGWSIQIYLLQIYVPLIDPWGDHIPSNTLLPWSMVHSFFNLYGSHHCRCFRCQNLCFFFIAARQMGYPMGMWQPQLLVEYFWPFFFSIIDNVTPVAQGYVSNDGRHVIFGGSSWSASKKSSPKN